MATYVLKKDGKLYNEQTNKALKQKNMRGVMYYHLWVDGKCRGVQASPYMIAKEYNINEYNIKIDEDVDIDKFIEMHEDYLRKKYDRVKYYHNNKKELERRVKHDMIGVGCNG